MKKIWIFIGMFSLIALLFATTQAFASPAALPQADPNKTPGAQATSRANEKATQGIGSQHGQKVNEKGIIAAVDASSLVLTLPDGSSLSFLLTSETSIKIPTLGKTASVADLVVGMQVQVQARQGDDGTLTAARVTVVPGKPLRTHRVGTVTAYLPGESITILAQDDLPYTFLLADQVKILPEERIASLVIGARVTIIAPRDVTGIEPTATGIVIHPAVLP